jgi:hypothetical protein
MPWPKWHTKQKVSPVSPTIRERSFSISSDRTYSIPSLKGTLHHVESRHSETYREPSKDGSGPGTDWSRVPHARSQEHARSLDWNDEIQVLREQFYIPEVQSFDKHIGNGALESSMSLGQMKLTLRRTSD